jgi:hypothetical protein
MATGMSAAPIELVIFQPRENEEPVAYNKIAVANVA